MNGKRYDVAIAMAVMALASPQATDNELRSMLATGSDIPPSRLDTALGELKQGLPSIRVLALMTGANTTEAVASMLQDAFWIDDDLHEATLGVVVKDEKGEEVARSTTKFRLDPEKYGDEDA